MFCKSWAMARVAARPSLVAAILFSERFHSPKLAAVVWVGYDQPRRLGERETGGGLALPIWIDYMSRALAGVPAAPRTPPAGLDVLDGEYYYASGAASAPGMAATGSPNPVR